MTVPPPTRTMSLVERRITPLTAMERDEIVAFHQKYNMQMALSGAEAYTAEGAAAHYEKNLWDSHFHAALLSAERPDGGSRTRAIKMTENRVIVGFVRFGKVQTPWDPALERFIAEEKIDASARVMCGQIHQFCALQGFQSRALGHAWMLYREAEQTLVRMGADMLLVQVPEAQTEACAFFERQGATRLTLAQPARDALARPIVTFAKKLPVLPPRRSVSFQDAAYRL